MTREILGKQLKAMRESRGFTIEFVASKVDLSKNTLERIEQGKYDFNVDILIRLTNAYAYGVIFADKHQ